MTNIFLIQPSSATPYIQDEEMILVEISIRMGVLHVENHMELLFWVLKSLEMNHSFTCMYVCSKVNAAQCLLQTTSLSNLLRHTSTR